MPSTRALGLIAGAATLLLAAALCALAAWRPGTPYDLIAYLGAMLSAGGDEPHHAWAMARAQLPPELYQELASGDAYRQRQSSDPAAFASVTPLYAVKLGYVWLLQAFAALGDPLRWAQGLAPVSAFAIIVTTTRWLARDRALLFAPVVFAATVAMGWFELARHATPDAIAIALTMPALYLWHRDRTTSASLLLGAAFLFRPDTIICAFALTLAALAFRREWRATLAATIAMAIASTVMKDWAGHPGWWVHVWFSTVTIQPTLEGFAPALSLVAYVKGFARGVVMSLTEFRWPYVLAVTLMAAGWVAAQRALPRPVVALELAMLLTIGGKFVLFPLPDDRLYLPFVLAMLLALAPCWPRPGRYEPSGFGAGAGACGAG